MINWRMKMTPHQFWKSIVKKDLQRTTNILEYGNIMKIMMSAITIRVQYTAVQKKQQSPTIQIPTEIHGLVHSLLEMTWSDRKHCYC